MDQSSNDNVEALFKAYLSICNKALETNKDDVPYKQICDTAEKMLKDNSVKLAVYDDRPKECYCLHIKDNQITMTSGCNRSDPKDAWRVNISYMERVVNNPDEYIKHPTKLDWDWLRNRLGI